MKIYTEEEILQAENLHELQDSFCGSGTSFGYEITLGELHWAKFIEGKYPIAGWVLSNIKNGILIFNDAYELSVALEGYCKATMLSDDTGLQKLFFWLYVEIEEEEEEIF